ncbi:MAG TPA: tetratricopeptide repeat protein [Anaerolineales bacterium]|nr:tetratricopeptide repeat protein [Anaerolineales bacterium]
MEDFLEYPFEPNTDVAERIMDALRKWGKRAFNDLFDNRIAGGILDGAKKTGYKNLFFQVMSDDPRILQWPWEALQDPQATYLAVAGPIERRLNSVPDPLPISSDLPRDRINILLITARPYEGDAHYRSISRPLVELIEQEDIPANVHVLRPPTFKNLRHHLEERPNHYHLIHFDGHGGYGQMNASSGRRHMYTGREEGVLVFEDENGKEDQISAEQLAGLLQEHPVPLMVMNACRSGMLGDMAQDPFASVAASLLKAGIRGVVAMAYSLYVSGAEVFLPEFYSELFKSGSVSQATWKGRQAMFGNRKRLCYRGRFDLNDFIVPVIYQQEPYELCLQVKAEAVKKTEKPELPEEAQDEQNPYGFIGRDRELLRLERAMRSETPAILVSGIGGVGKTTLARGFLKWLSDTEGMDGCLWLTFIDIRSAEYVINSMGFAFYGKDFLVHDIETKIKAIAEASKKACVVFVWDNFEAATGIPGSHVTANLPEEDRGLLLKLLERMRRGKSKILITSRSEEEWLGENRIRISIGGLIGEERWEFCDKILENLGLEVNREDPDFAKLMESLNGHPLMMRVILPRLEKITARQVIKALGSEAGELFTVLRFVVDGLDDGLRPLLTPLALHEQHVDAEDLESISKQIDEAWTSEKVDVFLKALVAAGLLRNITGETYEIHPALTGYLRSTLLKTAKKEVFDKWTREFVFIFGKGAHELTPRELHETQVFFHFNGANLLHALWQAKRLNMMVAQKVITQFLAVYTRQARNFSEAEIYFHHYAELSRESNDPKGEAVAYHQLGMIAHDRCNYKTAEEMYSKSLEISERLDNKSGAATTYNQLGIIAAERRNFETAKMLFLKSLELSERLGNEYGVAAAYHQLGELAKEHHDFETAEKWYYNSLKITESLGDKSAVAITYQQLGMIAAMRRDFDKAEKWYLKSLEIKERVGNELGVASIYLQLGGIAQERLDFKTAEMWYLKSLEITERLGVEYEATSAYHMLGMIAQRNRDFGMAEQWYYKSLEISKKLSNESAVAITYHQLGIVSQKRRELQRAEKLYLKSLEITERQGDESIAAGTYHQLGSIAQERCNFVTAEKLYLKSLEINERLGDESKAARTYIEIGILRSLQGRNIEGCEWFIKSIRNDLEAGDQEHAREGAHNFLVTFRSASEEERLKLRAMWDEAGLGPFPTDQQSD